MGIAQLVERCLAKAKVAGSSPVSHSKFFQTIAIADLFIISYQHNKQIHFLGKKIMHTRNSMKSVIAQGATVVKAIEEALKKADMPKEFFVKILEEAQSGFLGFGSKKAKIALFFKKEIMSSRGEGILHQDSYDGLFNNQSLQKQIDNQQRDTTNKDLAPQALPNQALVAKKPQQNIQKPADQRPPRASREHSVNRMQPINNKSGQDRSFQDRNKKDQDSKENIKSDQPLKDRDSGFKDPVFQDQRHQGLQTKATGETDIIRQDQRSTKQPQRFRQRELKPTQPRENSENKEEKLEISVPRAERPQRPERRLQDIPQRQLPNSGSDDSGEARQSYRNRRRSRYFSPRQPGGNDDGSKTSNSNDKPNNNDSNNS